MYVIVRDDGKFAAPPGQEKSYTDYLQDAWVFLDREKARQNVCPGNEQVVSLRSVLKWVHI